MAMDFYLLGPPDLRLPVNPSEVLVEASGRTETVTLVNLGDVEVPVGQQPTGISFSSFFPRDYDPGYCRYRALPAPEHALAQLLAWQESGRTVRLLITSTPVNMLVLVSRLSYRLVGGEPGDVHYDLALRQWREVKVRSVPAGTPEGGGLTPDSLRPRPDTKPVPKVYTVRPGDTLYGIAKFELGNGARWREVYDLNKSVVGPDPNIILPGQRLVMPT